MPLNSKYQVHTYSYSPELQDTNDLSEEEVIEQLSVLNCSWSGYGRKEDYTEDVMDFIAGERAVYVLVEEISTRRMVGYGYLSDYGDLPGGKVGYLGLAYVLPEHRRQGIYSHLVGIREGIAKRLGFISLLSEPASNGVARRALERRGYNVLERDELDQVVLGKELFHKER